MSPFELYKIFYFNLTKIIPVLLRFIVNLNDHNNLFECVIDLNTVIINYLKP